MITIEERTETMVRVVLGDLTYLYERHFKDKIPEYISTDMQILMNDLRYYLMNKKEEAV